MAEFLWGVAPGATLEVKPAVEVSNLGEGYEQRVGTVINGQPRKWSLKFTVNVATALTFLEARGGAESFDWTDPLGRSGKWVCREWKVGHVGETSTT
jgi:phage-related protein